MANSEYIAYMSTHEREILSVLLAQSGDEWKLRLKDGHHMSRAQQQSVARSGASAERVKDPSGDIGKHVGESEGMKDAEVHARDLMSKELSSAKEAWVKRRVRQRYRVVFEMSQFILLT